MGGCSPGGGCRLALLPHPVVQALRGEPQSIHTPLLGALSKCFILGGGAEILFFIL